MKYYLCQTADGPQLAPNQAEAKALDPKFVEHHVPDGKDERMAYVNDLLRKAHQPGGAQPAGVEVTPELAPVSAPELDPPPPRAPQPDEADMKRKLAQALRGMEAEAIEEKILEAKGPAFGRFLSASICRLGELGREGFEAFHATRSVTGDPDAAVGAAKSRARIPGSDERGLRYLTVLLATDLMKKAQKDG